VAALSHGLRIEPIPRIFLQSIEIDLDSGAGLHRYGKHPSGSSCQESTTSSSIKAIGKRVALLRQVWSSTHGEFSWGHASQWVDKGEQLAAASSGGVLRDAEKAAQNIPVIRHDKVINLCLITSSHLL
jgi:hypothetical protein